MKYSIFIIVVTPFLMLLSCIKEPIEKEFTFCTCCDGKTDTIEIIVDEHGGLIEIADYPKLAIYYGSTDGLHFFIPCFYPEYFKPEAGVHVRFSGVVVEDSTSYGVYADSLDVSYKCVRLDTIYVFE